VILNTSPERWRARALRYVLIYLLLACALVALRYQTRDIYPRLRELRAEREGLQRERDALSVEVQTLSSEQRVRAWALANGLRTYAQSPKQTLAFPPPLPAPQLPPAPPPTFLEVKTAWR